VYVVEYVVGLLIVLVTIVSVLFILVLPRQPRDSRADADREQVSPLHVRRPVATGADLRGKGLGARTDRSGGAPRATALLGRESGSRIRPDAHEYDALVRPRSDPSTDSALHRGRDSQRRGAEYGARHRRRRDVGRDRGLQIAYLPSLYNSFSRREALVTMLESRAGAPAWDRNCSLAINSLASSTRCPSSTATGRVAAEVTESHTTYPVLLLFRSPEPC